MSHFSVLVIGSDVESKLAPFHEFECTGEDNEYVQEIDRTKEVLEEYAKVTIPRVRAPDGTLQELFIGGNYNPQFWQRTGPKNFLTNEPTMVKVFPEGFEEVKVPAKDLIHEAEWINESYGWPALLPNQPRTEDHKFGFIELNDVGEVVRCVVRTNPNKKWDWWQIGGRWSGLLMLKPTASNHHNTALSVGSPGLMGECHPNNGVDQAFKGDIDFDAMRDAAEKRAAESYDHFHQVVAGREWQTWDEVRAKHEDIQQARVEYWAQPVIKDLAPDPFVDVDEFRMPREEFLKRARDAAFSTFAVLKDGNWYERGAMGWWGIVHDEMDQAAWNQEFAKLIDDLPDDALLTVVDCHI